MNGSGRADDEDDREGEQNEGTWELVSDLEEAEGAADEDWNHDGQVDSSASLWDSPASSERSYPFSIPQRRRPRFYRTFDDSSVQIALTELTERVVRPVVSIISNSAVRSRQATEHVSLELHNATNVKIRVIWMDYTGVPRHSLDIGPGQVRVASTYEGHPWTSYTLDGTRTQLLMNGCTVLWPEKRGRNALVCVITAPTLEDDSSSRNPEPVSQSSPSSEFWEAHGFSADWYSDLDIQQFARGVVLFTSMIWVVYKLIRFVA